MAAEGSVSFLARYKNQPAGTATLHVHDNKAYLLRGCVHPSFRKLGVYASLISHRLEILKKARIPLALILAKTSAWPICEKLGFQWGCEGRYFESNF